MISTQGMVRRGARQGGRAGLRAAWAVRIALARDEAACVLRAVGVGIAMACHVACHARSAAGEEGGRWEVLGASDEARTATGGESRLVRV